MASVRGREFQSGGKSCEGEVSEEVAGLGVQAGGDLILREERRRCV